jgi:3-hydroxyacyl-CoA dehydrogenase
MGNGIAQTAASSGFDVVMCDIEQSYVIAASRISGRVWIDS